MHEFPYFFRIFVYRYKREIPSRRWRNFLEFFILFFQCNERERRRRWLKMYLYDDDVVASQLLLKTTRKISYMKWQILQYKKKDISHPSSCCLIIFIHTNTLLCSLKISPFSHFFMLVVWCDDFFFLNLVFQFGHKRVVKPP